MKATHAYWPLSAFYFFFFAALGALLPYWPLYLASLGFGPDRIGALMAVVMATKIVAPNVWGWIADRSGRRMRVVRAAAVAAATTFAGVLLGDGFWWLAGVMVLFSFFWNAALPQFEAVTLTRLGAESHRYTRIRLWGSVGFIASVTALGLLVGERGPEVVPLGVLLLMAGIAASSLLVAEAGPAGAEPAGRPLLHVLREPRVLALLGSCLLMQASHGPYYAFFSIYLEAHGYSSPAIGVLWALGVVAEVALFVVMHRMVARVGLRRLFLAAFALTTLRWLMTALLVDRVSMLVLAQCLHAASFGVYHAVAIQLVHRFFVAELQGRGQALYSSASFGLGGALGSLAAGFAWSAAGATATWLGAAAASAVALGIVWRWLHAPPAAA